MRLSKEAKITDEKLFCESHRQRVLAGGKLSEPYLKRLEKYAFDKGLKLCNKCYEVYKEDHQCK